MKTQHFTLSIPEPCGESWEEMQPCASGKFCGSCQKTVVDFTGFSDVEIAMFFADKAGQEVCGRFYADQISAKVFSYTALAKKPYRTLAMAASVAALTVLSLAANGQEIKRSLSSIDTRKEEKLLIDPETSIVSVILFGQIVDRNQKPIDRVVVEFKEGRKTKCGVLTDANGNYHFNVESSLFRKNNLNAVVRASSGETIGAFQLEKPINSSQWHFDFVIQTKTAEELRKTSLISRAAFAEEQKSSSNTPKNSKNQIASDTLDQATNQFDKENKVLLIGAAILRDHESLKVNLRSPREPEKPLLQMPSNKTYTGEEWDRLQKSVQDSAGQQMMLSKVLKETQ